MDMLAVAILLLIASFGLFGITLYCSVYKVGIHQDASIGFGILGTLAFFAFLVFVLVKATTTTNPTPSSCADKESQTIISPPPGFRPDGPR